MDERFGAPWGKGVRWVTGVAAAMFAASWAIPTGLAPLALGALLRGTAPFAVRGYSVGARRVRVRRLGWETTLPLEGLSRVEPNPDALRGSIRLFGIGGLYASVGHFRNKRLGRFRAWATDGRRAVVLEFPDREVVLTPDDLHRFAEAVRAELARLHTPG